MMKKIIASYFFPNVGKTSIKLFNRALAIKEKWICIDNVTDDF